MENRPTEMIETPYMKIWKEEGIIYCAFTSKLIMNLEIAQHCVRERMKFSAGISHPCLINMSGVKSITGEARRYMAEEGSGLIKAGALLVDSALSRIIGNFFLTFNKPTTPTGLFSDKESAVAWLKNYL